MTGETRPTPPRRALALGTGALALVALAAPLSGACSCEPAGPPRTETCASASSVTATGVRLFGYGSAELVDGAAPPLRFGAQGGSHWGFEMVIAPGIAVDCVDVSLELHAGSPTGRLVGSYVGAVRAHGETDGIHTSQIVIFPSLGSDGTVYAIASAYGASRTVILCDGFCDLPDGGVTADAP